MGDPRKQRKKFETPRFPWRSDVLQSELRLIGEYGLRDKRELWHHETMLSKFRAIARSLLSIQGEERLRQENQLVTKLKRLGILPDSAVLDNVLDLTIENILERRLQTLVFRKGLTRTIYQARQLITHGHISIDETKVLSPSYLVPRDEENKIAYAAVSPLSNPSHPLRTTIEVEVETTEGQK